jgi:hypothetical protein
VCVADVNGDSFDDVLIGAPLEYVNQSSGSIIVDSGSVYVYFGTGSSVSDHFLIKNVHCYPLSINLLSGYCMFCLFMRIFFQLSGSFNHYR